MIRNQEHRRKLPNLPKISKVEEKDQPLIRLKKRKKKEEFRENILKRLGSLDYIPPEDIPNIDLYMDQVTTFMDEHLSSLKRHEDDKMLTKTMINNYSKNKLLPSPEKKKYSKEHMLLLIFIYYFKNILSINDIASILGPLTEDYFQKEDNGLSLEDVYREIFKISRENTGNITKSILHEYSDAKNAFEKEEDPDKRKFLTDFAFIASLCFDIYVRKAIVESMIDSGVLCENRGKEEKKAGKKQDKKG